MTLLKAIWDKKTGSLKYLDIMALACLAAGVAFFLWKASYSMYFEDESFYVAFSYRLAQGDSLFTDEWNKAQMFSFLLYLPTKIFLAVNGSTQGIILFFRWMFVAFQATVSSAVYLMLRKYGLFGLAASAVYFLHIPFMFMVMSYNTISFGLLALTTVIFATDRMKNRTAAFLTGLMLAGAVLCNPLLALFYAAFSAAVMLQRFAPGKIKGFQKLPSPEAFSPQNWRWLTLGVFTLASVFAAFVLSRATPREMMDNLAMLFADPAGFIADSALSKRETAGFWEAVALVFRFSPCGFSALAAVSAVIVLDRKRWRRRLGYLAALCAIVVFLLAQILLSAPGTTFYFFWMLPFGLAGFPLYMLTVQKNKAVFFYLWMTGFAYALILGISSDIAVLAGPFGLGISCLAGVLFAGQIFREHSAAKDAGTGKGKQAKISRLVAAALPVFLLAAQAGAQITVNASVHRFSQENFFISATGAAASRMDTVIRKGPYKGIRTTAATVRRYDAVLSDLDVIGKGGDGPVLVTGYLPWAYLYLERPVASYSTEIFTYIGNARLARYYELHPEKEPACFYVPRFAKINVDNATQQLNDALLYEKPEDVAADIRRHYDCIDKTRAAGQGFILESRP